MWFIAAIIGAIIGAISAAVSGGNIAKGALIGAIGGFLTWGMGNIYSAMAGVTASTSAFEVAGINAAAAFTAGTITGFIAGGKGSAVFRNAAIGAGIAFGLTMLTSGGNSGGSQKGFARADNQIDKWQGTLDDSKLTGNLGEAGEASKVLVNSGVAPETAPVTGLRTSFKAYGTDFENLEMGGSECVELQQPVDTKGSLLVCGF